VAVTDGSLTKNFNKTGVRLWTCRVFERYNIVSEGDSLKLSAVPTREWLGAEDRRQ
jgi:hypothetical protein